MKTFHITVRTVAHKYPPYTAIASSAFQACEDAAALFDEPCGVTAINVEVR